MTALTTTSERTAHAGVGEGRLMPGGNPGAILTVGVLLMAVGVVMVASASASLDASLIPEVWWHSTLGRHFIFCAAGLATLLATAWLAGVRLSRPAARRWLPFALFVVAVLALVLVLIPWFASATRGSQRWLRLGPAWLGLGFQPSELAKLALVGALAAWYGRRAGDAKSLRLGFMPGALAVGVCVLLVGWADFGTAALIGVVGALMLLTAGVRWRYLFLMGVAGACGAGALVLAQPYRWRRIEAYVDLWRDPLGAGYHAIQSLTTIASGGYGGVGLGAGVQKYGYLPESRTDFIFAVLCEETGMIGGGLVIGLFLALAWLGLRVMWSARSRFERLMALGLTAMLTLQAVMHMAVVTAVAPTTGMSLPLISVGGTGMLSSCVSLGLLAAIAARAEAGEPTEVAGTVSKEVGVVSVPPLPYGRGSDEMRTV